MQNIVSLKAAEDLLTKYEDDYEKYKSILDKKMKILQAIENKSLTAEGYKKSLEVVLTSIKE